MTRFSAVLIGNDTLAIHCGTMLLDAGHALEAVVSRNPDVRDWAKGRGLAVVDPGPALEERLADLSFDWLFSIANLDLLPEAVLALAAKGAVNFHDGPLPRYAGLNAPVWAMLHGEAQHGVTWHLITGAVDEGDILQQRMFDIGATDTALTLNRKCYAAAIDSFPAVLAALAKGHPPAARQDLSARSYLARDKRPEAAGLIDLSAGTDAILRLVRALDHGDHPNPLTLPKLALPGGIALVGAAEAADGTGAPGTVLAIADDSLTLACGDGAVRLSGLRRPWATPLRLPVAPGDRLPRRPEAAAAEAALAATLPNEGHWRAQLLDAAAATLPDLGGQLDAGPLTRELALPAGTDPELAKAAFAGLILRMAEATAADFALATACDPNGIQSDRLPVRLAADTPLGTFAEALAQSRARAPMAADLPARLGRPAPARSEVAICDDPDAPLLPGTALMLATAPGRARLTACPDRLSPAAFALIGDRVQHLLGALSPEATPQDLSLLPPAERQKLLTDWNATATPFEAACIHTLFERQVARTPDAPALSYEGTTLTYAQVNACANRAAHRLIALGVTPGTLVGLHLRRSVELVIGALSILKAGGAYVPLDPAYPADRIALYIEDSAAPVIVTDAALADDLPLHTAAVLLLEDTTDAPATNPDTAVTPADLAYLIFTSGSTGRPKGVMIEHRNVVNFFAGMDPRIPHDPPGTWLAVTSLSFDISVLELFWTLARGFHVVVAGDENRALVSSGQMQMTGRGMEFSLFYWGNDDGIGRDKYRLLLEGARFADDHGFCAVWTPERHFHAFGGPYPNPSVTGAAVAAVTRNLSVRAGSCVAPLHHTARIAEEWAVIDNLTNGRAGLAIASGWQPDDFVLRPENAPPHNKAAMFAAIDQLRRLWAGEPVPFPAVGGGTFDVLTQPRPVSTRLPIWVTTAGNPETWREAGSIGANVLTHLLGQSIDEVAGKIALYHDALRASGHDPKDHKVTLMLHSFLAETRDKAREIAREPMKAYLRSAAGLIKQYAWAFPAFKKPAGVSNPMELDLRSLSEDEMEGILDFAFLRYFDDSGLFGTIEDAMLRVEQLKRIGVDEIACLIDYGISPDQVLEGLRPLAEVVARANRPDELTGDDFSIAAQIVRHGVTHLQCTPSMARMLVTNDEARIALGSVSQLMIGGEALPGTLVADLKRATRARIENMYGPTETTIWSTTQPATGAQAVTSIGTPIANTRVHVLDEGLVPAPVGLPGELFIGGAGVARGYWQRPDLTSERFIPDPFGSGGRLYRTGDVVRWRADGTLDFLGRADHQIKLRGYRIELGEIEAAIEADPAVTAAVVIAREDVPGLVQLVGYYTGAGVDEGGLRARLAAQLPEHMRPGRLMALEAFPLTPNKKIDRKALPPPSDRRGPADISAKPQTGSEGRIAAIWARILGVAQIGPRDSFFDLGGHSLLAVQAHRDIREALAVPALSITDIFRFPTLAALAGRVDALAGAASRGAADAEASALRKSAPVTTQAQDTPPTDRAAARADAMARRRDLRARRSGAG